MTLIDWVGIYEELVGVALMCGTPVPMYVRMYQRPLIDRQDHLMQLP